MELSFFQYTSGSGKTIIGWKQRIELKSRGFVHRIRIYCMIFLITIHDVNQRYGLQWFYSPWSHWPWKTILRFGIIRHACRRRKHSLVYVRPSDPHTGMKSSPQNSEHTHLARLSQSKRHTSGSSHDIQSHGSVE